MKEEQMERIINAAMNVVITMLVVFGIFQDLGISIEEMIRITPEMLQMLLEQYFVFFWMVHWALYIFILAENYLGGYLKVKYPEAYRKRYLPAAASILFALSLLSYIAFRRFLDLFLMVCSAAVMLSRGGSSD